MLPDGVVEDLLPDIGHLFLFIHFCHGKQQRGGSREIGIEKNFDCSVDKFGGLFSFPFTVFCFVSLIKIFFTSLGLV